MYNWLNNKISELIFGTKKYKIKLNINHLTFFNIYPALLLTYVKCKFFALNFVKTFIMGVGSKCLSFLNIFIKFP